MTDGGTVLAVPVGPDDHAVGPPDAPLTLVEYGDYQCPYCGKAYPIVQKIQRRFEGSMLFVFRNLPLGNVHPYAESAAEVAEAGALQGRFWEVHDLLYENQRDLGEKALLGYAAQAGADVPALTAALASGTPRQRVQTDVESAIRSGANGTPTFFVNGSRYDGSWALEPFGEYLQGVLDRL